MNSQAAVRLHGLGTSLCKKIIQSKQNIGSLSILYCHSNICSKQTDFLTVRNLSTFNIHTRKETLCTGSFGSVHIGQKNHLMYKELMKIVQNQRRHAGHSHWQNIQHNKGAQDREKSATAAQVTQRIRQAIREGSSTDPKLNSALAKALEHAKAKSVPNETIQRVLKAAENSAASGKEELIEGSGMGGLMFVVRSFTDKPSKARSEVQSRLKRYGAKIGTTGTSMHSFKQTGIVEIELNEEDSRDHDEHIEMALEAEAEDVSMETREDGKDVLQMWPQYPRPIPAKNIVQKYHCHTEDEYNHSEGSHQHHTIIQLEKMKGYGLNFECNHLTVKQVKNYLETKGKNVIYAESVFIPLQTVILPEEGMENLGKLIDRLKEFDHVEEVFTNAVLQS